MDLEKLRMIAESASYGLVGMALVLTIFAWTGRQLAGFSRANVFGLLATVEWLTALCYVIDATDGKPVDRGVLLFLALWWGYNGWLDYKLWKKHDDGDGPTKKRVRAWVRSRMPRPLRLAPVKG